MKRKRLYYTNKFINASPFHSSCNSLQIEISIAVVLGEWDKTQDPDCNEDFCADPRKIIEIEKYFYPLDYKTGSSKQHDILLLKLARPAIITGNQFFKI